MKTACVVIIYYCTQDGGRRLEESEYAEALFNHVVNGTNYFTGRKDVRMDFISLHRKVRKHLCYQLCYFYL